MSNETPILVTGAAENVGSVGRSVVKLLRERDLPVRALVHRLDERSQALSEMGAGPPYDDRRKFYKLITKKRSETIITCTVIM